MQLHQHQTLQVRNFLINQTYNTNNITNLNKQTIMANEEKKDVTNVGEAVSVLIQAVNIAQAKGGVYTFSDAAKIHSALQFMDEVAKADMNAKQAEETVKAKIEEVDASVEK